ncbi:FAD-dependent oxidoreductase [Piscibacillus salipiscarius]|uniref:FAD-dependent oxidoreductase n=1 Tax=Piscibacillus salipiscarius TaxID=299480 RepID=UPI0006CF9F32|nr:FAD-dependent oxidoreductase [Piscibacillus salipiscarius]
MKYDVIIIGSGLAGLTAGLLLTKKGYRVLILEKKPFVGGRTASWDEDGMKVESGFHRVIGYYKHFPRVLKKAGINMNKIVMWEEVMDFRSARKGDVTTFGMAPVHGPLKLLKGMFGNTDTISYKDRMSLFPFFINGMKDYLKKPDQLDQVSVKEYAERHHVTNNAFHLVLVPLTAGIFFLPPERFSAYVFFGLLAPSLPRFYKMRMGGFLGGMSELFSDPIARVIEKQGGTILRDHKVTRMIYENGRVKGVVAEGQEFYADETVLATEIGAAKKLITDSSVEHACFNNLLQLPDVPAVTIQFELDRPATPYDRTTFGAGTSLASFTEQSRTTFKHVPGRMSCILAPAERFINMESEDIYQIAIKDAKN